ncbi:MAG: hypothetical protein PHG65_10310, partial [Kiritimatiellae bacterium]|nr:hypothetical protein [Kiritimatiellia bacterium]
ERAGLQFGAWWLAAKKIWQNHPNDYDAIYSKDSDLRELYAKWNTPFTKSSIQAGRFGMTMTALDGNSHQGVQVMNEDIPHLVLRAAVIDRWINNDRVDMFYKGITGWVDANDVREGSGREYWLGSAAFDWNEQAGITPFIGYQEEVMAMYGADLYVVHKLDGGRAVGVDATMVVYGNETPREVQPDYEDVFSWLVHGYVNLNTNLMLGLGWYGVSDDRGDIAAGLFDTFDPLEEDDTIPYNDQNNAQLYYTDAAWNFDPFDLTLAYGYGVNDAIDVKSHEVDAVLTVDLTKSLQAKAYASYNTYSGDEVSDFTKMGLSLIYSY